MPTVEDKLADLAAGRQAPEPSVEDKLASLASDGQDEPSVEDKLSRLAGSWRDPLDTIIADKILQRELGQAPKKAKALGTSVAEQKAPSMARRALDLAPERVQEFFEGDEELRAAARGELSSSTAGARTEFMGAIDVLDLLTSPIERPKGALTSARADLNALRGLSRQERDEWAERLSGDDARKAAIGQLVEALNEQEAEGGGALDQLLARAVGATADLATGPLLRQLLPDVSPQHGVEKAMDRLALAYYSPNIADPYGGTGLPRPWQRLDERGRPLAGEAPADVTDVVLRGLALTPEGSEERASARGELQRLGVSVTGAVKGALTPGEGIYANPRNLLAANLVALLGGEGAEKVADAYRESAEDAIAQGDTRVGLFLGEVAYTTLGDFISKRTPLGALLGVNPKAVKTPAGLMSEHGAKMLDGQRQRAASDILEEAGKRARETGADLSAEEVAVLSRDADNSVVALFANVAIEASRKGMVVESLDVAKAVKLSEDGTVVAVHADVAKSLVPAGESVFQKGAKAKEALDAAIRIASTTEDGTARVLTIRGKVLPLGRIAPQLPAMAAEAARRSLRPLESRFESFGRWSKETKKFVPVKPSDLIGDAGWRSIQAAKGQMRRSFHRMSNDVDDAAFEVYSGLANKKQRETWRNYLEVLGNPSIEGDLGAEGIRILEEAIAGGLRILPGEKIAAEERLARDAATASAIRLDEATLRHNAAVSSAMADAAPAEALAELSAAERSLASARAAVGGAGSDAAELADAADIAAKNRLSAMKRAIESAKRVRRARGTADEAAARLEKKKAQLAATKAQADAYQAERLANEAAGKTPSLDASRALDEALRRVGEAQLAVDDARAAHRAANGALASAEAERVAAQAVHAAAEARHTAASDALGLYAKASSRAASRLADPVTIALQTSSDAAVATRDLLRSMTGFASEADYAANKVAHDAITAAIKRADEIKKTANFDAAVRDMTVAEARQAERAITRVVEKSKKTGKPLSREAAQKLAADEWAALPPKVKAAVEQGRAFFDKMYRTLKAEGRLPKDWDKARFLERMQVEGYVRHVLSRGGQKSFKRLNKKYNFNTTLDETRLRTRQFSVAEVNEAAREDVAKMIWEVGEGAGGAKATADDIAEIIVESGLDKIRYFETDGVMLMRMHGKDISRASSNARFIDTMRVMFPEGKTFELAAKNPVKYGHAGVQNVDVLAAGSGFRRVNGVSHAHAVLDDAAWKGWSKYKVQIDNILKEGVPEEQIRALNKLLDGAGVSRGSVVRKEMREVVTDSLYLPEHIADFVEGISNHAWVNAWKTVMPGPFGKSFDAFTSFFKVAVTVGAPAFHGRNFLSNVLTGLMVFGAKAANPITQMDGIAILLGKEDSLYRIRIGNVWEEKTIGAWKAEMREAGVIGGRTTIAEIDSTFASRSVRGAQGAIAAGAGGAAGAAYGAATAEEGDVLQRVMLGGLAGAGAGAALSGGFDIYARQAAGVLRAGPITNKATWAEAANTVMEDVAPVLKEANLAASAAGTATAAAALATGGITLPMAPAAYGAVLATKLGGEGFFTLAGAAGQNIEQQARISNYLTGRKAGMSSFESGAKVDTALIDYDDLTNLERYGLRRAFPFYSWTSRNLMELQPFLATQRPAASSALNHTLMAVSKLNPEEGDVALLPEYLRYRMVVNIAMGKVFAGLGLPIESAVEILKKPNSVFAMAHPIVPFFVRFGLGYDPYYNVPMEEIRSTRDVQHLWPWLQEMVGYRDDVVKNIDQVIAHGEKPRLVKQVGWFKDSRGEWKEDAGRGAETLALFRSFPPWRLVSEAGKILNDTFMRGAGGGEGPPASGVERVLAVTTGLKPYGIDYEALKRTAWYRLKERLTELLREEKILRSGDYVDPIRPGPAESLNQIIPGLIPTESGDIQPPPQ